MRWNSAAGASPGLSRTTLRYLRLRLKRPSSTESPSSLPMVCSSKPYRCTHLPSSERPNSVLMVGLNL